jgi:hypothetical protein
MCSYSVVASCIKSYSVSERDLLKNLRESSCVEASYFGKMIIPRIESMTRIPINFLRRPMIDQLGMTLAFYLSL